MSNRGFLVFCAVVVAGFYLAGDRQEQSDSRQLQPPPKYSTDTQKPAPENSTSKKTTPPPAPVQTLAQLGQRDTKSDNLATATPTYVAANNVNLRSAPGQKERSLAKLPKGTQVLVTSTRGGWSKVTVGGGKLSGWISSNFLVSSLPPALRAPAMAAPSTRKVSPAAKAKPVQITPKLSRLSQTEIVAAIIQRSLGSYSGRCPCPYNRDRAGKRCGARSAYMRPRGAAPICYAQDVTPEMIAAFRD